MTETTTADEEEEPPAEGAEAGDERVSENDDQPDIEAGEQADMSGLADLADQVEAEAGVSPDDDGDDADSSDDQAAGAPAPRESGGADWGDLYCSTVTTGLNAVIDEFGDDDAEHIDESLARDLHLDEYVNEWMREQGKAEMDPAQGMILATAALCLTVLVSKTDLPNQAMQKAKSGS